MLYNKYAVENHAIGEYMNNLKKGIYPVMLTPFKDGNVDYGTVRQLTQWYINNGCTGIFSVCQSSEMFYLSLDEKVRIAKEVVNTSSGQITVVASGHTSDKIEDQAYELNKIAEIGVEAVILVTNRLDLNDEGEDVWLKNADKLISLLNKDVFLGFYECPKPYKKLLTPRMLDWCLQNDRFRFIKDTCCEPVLLNKRLNQLKDSELMLFNANGQTLLSSLQDGAAGYSGVIANYCPSLFAWLYNNYQTNPQKAKELSDMLSLLSFTENSAYPVTAKYYQQLEGNAFTLETRVVNSQVLDAYQKHCVEQQYRIIQKLKEEYEVL